MVKRNRLAIVLIALILLSMLGWRSSRAQINQPVYFPETGHQVINEFHEFYYSVDNPEVVYGLPITSAFISSATSSAFPSTNDTLVQYFERARFELDETAPADLRVRLTPLGALLHNKPGPRAEMPANLLACRYFPETDHQVCHNFLEFFDKNGGVAQFGYPISDYEMLGGYKVQYFQRARMEWHPEAPPSEQIRLGDLGVEYFNKYENPIRILPNGGSSNLPQAILDLQVHAFTGDAVMSLRGEQSIYVLVRDQNHLPVADAQVEIAVRPPGGSPYRYDLPPTDANGVSHLTFPVNVPLPGTTIIEVSANYTPGASERLELLPLSVKPLPAYLSGKTVVTYKNWW